MLIPTRFTKSDVLDGVDFKIVNWDLKTTLPKRANGEIKSFTLKIPQNFKSSLCENLLNLTPDLFYSRCPLTGSDVAGALTQLLSRCIQQNRTDAVSSIQNNYTDGGLI